MKKRTNHKTNRLYHCNKCRDQNVLRECLCGCGQIISLVNKFYKYIKYKKGHGQMGVFGPDSNGWKGGEIYDSDGYKYAYSCDHPYKNCLGKVFKHRLIYEHYLKILFDEDVFIPRKWLIHHIDEIKDDNSLINLEPVDRSKHMSIHFKGKKVNKK